MIDDRNAGEQARNLRGTLAEMLLTLQQYNQSGWGVFAAINQLDGQGFKLDNVTSIRAHVVDLDDPLNSHDGYQRAISSPCPPHIAVQTSENKLHLYWLTEPYAGNEWYSEQQRKLRQLYNGDKQVTDATRVLRVPGFYHCKDEPQLVTCWQVHNNPRYTHQQIADSLAGVNVISTSVGSRSPLGTESKAAPSLPWLTFALDQLFDPTDMERDDWLGITAAFKQAGWSLTDEDTLLKIWLDWCARYPNNDTQENMKMWNSIRDSEVGWSRFERLSQVKAWVNAHNEPPKQEMLDTVKKAASELPLPPVNKRPELPDVLDETGKQLWFAGCYFINTEGRIFTREARFMNATQFNGAYGGKEFCLKPAGGKVTDEPWKAALRSLDWTIPKVDHTRFLPSEPPETILQDELGRDGLNVYVPPRVKAVQGDISRWTDFLSRILATAEDVQIFDSYLAHCIKYPGHKIPWAVVLQSTQGVGKQLIAEVVKFCLGETYTYTPKAEELVSGASRFNAWMREKVFITVDEIRVGDRRDLLEGLKPLITDRRVAVEGKGVDQKMEDNAANWLFLTNFKDAVPIDENERRYCVFYSSLQTGRSLEKAGLSGDYFNQMYDWVQNGGYESIAHHYLSHSIQRGSLPHRAPKTSSYDEVIRVSRSPLNVLLDDKLSSGERGFRSGYISWPLLLKAIDTSSMRSRPPGFAIEQALETKGYQRLGFTAAPVGGEDLTRPSLIYALDGLDVAGYEVAQGK